MWQRRKHEEPTEHVEFVTHDDDRFAVPCSCPRRHDHDRLTSRALATAGAGADAAQFARAY